MSTSDMGTVDSGEEKVIEDSIEKAEIQDDKEQGRPDPLAEENDASTGEIFSYSLGSLAGSFSNATILLLPLILMLVLKINPILVGFVTAMKVIWDAITDPIMATITDNCRSRWGRRRPFILVGGLILPIILAAGWWFMPKNDKIEPNIPPIPSSSYSEKQLAEFGQLLVAYDADAIRLQSTDMVGNQALPKTINGTEEGESSLIEKAVRKINSSSVTFITPESLEEDAADAETPLLSIQPSVSGLDTAIATYDESDSVEDARGRSFAISLTTDQGVSVINKILVNEPLSKKRVGGLSRLLTDTLRGETERVSISVDGIAYDNEENMIANRGAYRALVHGAEMALIETLGTHFKVPYWRIFEEKNKETDAIELAVTVDESIKQRIRESLPTDPETFMPALKFLVYASGEKMDLDTKEVTESDLATIDTVRKVRGLSSNHALYLDLWENVNYSRAKGRMSLYKRPQEVRKKKSSFQKIKDGFAALDSADAADKSIVITAILFLMAMATFQTIYGVPYYALGIEIAPSYDGRTKVVAVRALLQKIVGFIAPWLLPLCLLPRFSDGVDGVLRVSIIFGCISMPLVLLTFFRSKERTHVAKSRKKVPFFKSIKQTVSHSHFWRIFGLYFIVQQGLGIFNVVGVFVAIYYVFGGDLLLGNSYQAVVGSFAVGLALLSIPVVAWMCKRWEKHNAMRFAMVMMMIGCVLKWFCYNPEHPELLFIVPFFFSFGISAVYTVLSTMMADVTDADELITGSRREGMFGAVNSMMMKVGMAIGSIMAGVIVTASGFEVTRGIYQDPGVFTNMRLLFSIIPACALSLGLLILRRYPLTRERMTEIKTELKARREKEAQESKSTQS